MTRESDPDQPGATAAVALLGEPRLAASLGRRLGMEVVATTASDHLASATALTGRAELVVGLAGVPWPTAEQLHAEASSQLEGYTGVVSWHGLPTLLQQLADAVRPAVRRGAHLLITAPDPGPETPPEDVLFLREVAEGITARLEADSRSIAWRGTTRTPTALDALRSLVEAHDRLDVIECPVSPGLPADPDLATLAERLGIRLTSVDLGRQSRVEVLAEVVQTVVGHEQTP